jgi:hypothetical protein
MITEILGYIFGPNKAEPVVVEARRPYSPQVDPEMGPPYSPSDPPPFEGPEVPDDLIDELIADRLTFPNRQKQDLSTVEFMWETNDGDQLFLSDMATPHLFYTLRMIYNHSVPPAFRVGDFKRRKNVDQWPIDYRQQAGREIFKELEGRADYEHWMQLEVKDMRTNADFLSSLQQYAIEDVLTTDKIREKLRQMGITDPGRYIPRSKMVDTSAQDALDRAAERRENAEAQRANRKAKRMKRAVKTDLPGCPGVRCMEHRSYCGLRNPRVDCNACKQVYRARQRRRKDPRFYRKA